MSKLLYITRSLIASFVLLLAFANTSFAHVHKITETKYKAPAVRLTDDVLQRRLENISSQVDYEVTKEVKRRINEYTVLYPKSSETILGKVTLYFPLFEREIHRRNLPDELKYVAVVESLLRPEGTSKSGAAGLWQILKSTGRWLGLEINNDIDERRDPEKSTVAALKYLDKLYNEFGDWTLAIAAYNCGPGNMRKAIRKSGGLRNYWEVRQFLPKETQEYIPRIVAAAYLMNYYHLHNLQPNVPDQDLRFTSKVVVSNQMRFSDIEKQLDLKPGIIKKINPSFVYAVAGKSDQTNQFYIPSSKYMDFLQFFQPESYALIKAEESKRLLNREKEAQQVFVKRDSIRNLEILVSNFIQKIKAPDKEYNIPHSMRSNLSYLRA